MTDPKRLLAGEATEFERYLLGAARHERPSLGQRHRMRRALIFAEFGILASTAKAAASVASHAVIALLAASMAGGASSSTLDVHQSTHEKPAAQITTRAPVPGDSVRHTAEAPYDATAERLPLVEEAAPDAKIPSRPRSEATPRRPSSDLREEIALMDQARVALRSGAPSKALATLDQYRSQFPRGSFGQEAAVLRIEALASSGNRPRATAEARRFLSAHPNSPHAERLRLVIAGGTAPAR